MATYRNHETVEIAYIELVPAGTISVASTLDLGTVLIDFDDDGVPIGIELFETLTEKEG